MPKRPGSSPVWNFFTIDSDGHAKCKNCSSIISRKRGHTKAMAAHILMHSQSPPSKEHVADVEKRVARFLAATNTPANVVEHVTFRELMSKEDQASLPSRRQLHMRIVPTLASDIQTDLRKELSGKALSVMTDAWTSKGGRVSLNAVVASYMDDQWNLKSVVLAATPLSGRHTAQSLKAEIERVIGFYGITVVSVTSDSAANILKAVADMNLISIPCFLHQLHLIVSNSLDDWSDRNIISVLKMFARTLNLSSSKRDYYFKSCEKFGLRKVGVPQCVPTRWNSTFEMMERANEQMPAVKETLNRFKLGKITSNQERELVGMCNLLRPFLQYTLRISSDSVVATEIFLVADELDEHLKKIVSDESRGISVVAESMRNDLSRRMNKYHNLKSLNFLKFLDPRVRSNYDGIEWDMIEKDLEEKYGTGVISSIQTSTATSAYPMLQAKFRKNAVKNSPLSNEMKRYVNECTSGGSISLALYPPHFWRDRRRVYPRLASIALSLFTISPSSVAAERLFSSAGCIYKSHLRNRLSGNLAESLHLIRLVGQKGRELSVLPSPVLVEELTGADNETTGVASDDESDEENEELDVSDAESQEF